MIDKIKALRLKAESIREQTRLLNMSCSELNGVAVTIPKDISYPLNAFRGSKVILANVQFFNDTGEIVAAIKLPHKGDHAGHIIMVTLDETWFTKPLTGAGYNG